MAGFLIPRRSRLVRWRGTLEGLLPEQHPARFIWQVLLSLDFSELEGRYSSVWEGPGRPPYHPRVLAALWIYGLIEGLETAAAIAKACTIRDDFRWLAGGLSPSDQTLLNFLTDSADEFASLWAQVLKSMHQAGHIDLSVIAEDGTKLRANASRRSFLTATDIAGVVETLKSQIAEKLKEITSCTGSGRDCKAQIALRNLELRLSRAELAICELDQRTKRHEAQPPKSKSDNVASASPAPKQTPKFTWKDFKPTVDPNVVVCPAGCELYFIGQYPTENGRSLYRLYGRSNCRECLMKTQCTNSRRRRIKIPLDPETDSESDAPATTSDPPADEITKNDSEARTSCSTPETADEKTEDDAHSGREEQSSGPKASITEPEAVLMLATSEKRWAPSYNADLAVTRHGIIVSQFLTKHPTDFHHFQPALQAVISTVGKPESWVGDGHYGTKANVLIAENAGVFLYAPPAWTPSQQDLECPSIPVKQDCGERGLLPGDDPQLPTERFGRNDFRFDPEHNVLICPANQELRFIGVYPTDDGFGSYRLYGRSNCRNCAIKSRCTDASKRRRVKVPVVSESQAGVGVNEKQDIGPLLRSLEDRMKQVGDAVLKFRRETIEPVNAQLKQHGLGRFHVRGLARCAAVLTLACIAHNLSKWKAREAARAIKAVA